MPLVPVNAAKTVTRETVLVECWCTQHKIVCCTKQVVLLFEQHPVLYPVQISRFKIPVPFQQREYGRLAVWAHTLPFPGPGAASTAAGWCISAVFLLCSVGVVLCANMVVLMSFGYVAYACFTYENLYVTAFVENMD